MPTIEERLKLVISYKLGMDPSQISSADNFVTDLGADSLDLVELVQDAEEEFSIEIPDEDAVNIHTVGDAYTYLVQHLPSDPPDPSDPPAGTPYERLKAIIVDKLGVDEIRIVREASFVEDLGADSLDVVELVQAADEEFNIEIPDEAAELLTTVGLAIDYIEEHI